MRVGIGFDAHRFSEGRRLVLGGTEVPFDRGLAGHSDADVVLHAVMDALLGAAGAGDIGAMFPDDDPRYRDRSSLLMLSAVRERVEAMGFKVGNLDVTVICEEPRVAPFAPRMRSAIAEVLGSRPEDVSIKGTTTEGMGFTGAKEGIAAMAVVLLED